MIKKKINLIASFMILTLIIVITFVDTNVLNALYIDNNNIVIKEVNTYIEEKVVHNEALVSLINNQIDRWVWPTSSNYILTDYYSYYHGAIDISSGYGTEIYAANSGTVISVKGGCTPGYLSCNGLGGNYIVIKHNSNNYYTVYMHLKDIYVYEGQTVSSGQVIGTMGNTGNVIPAPTYSNPYAGTHLHFCLYIGEPFKGGYAINPMNLY